MTKPVLLWDAGAGEIRAGLIESGTLSEFRLIRMRRKETARFATGEQYTARIVQKLGQNKALVSLGAGADAVLDPCPSGPEGRLIAVEMVRPPIPEPGRWKRAKVRAVQDGLVSSQACWHPSAEPWEAFLLSAAQTVSEIICPTFQAAKDVEGIIGDAVPVRIDSQAIDDADFDGLMDRAVSGEWPITDGGLTLERTRALMMIDVDGVGDPLTLNLEAARAIPALLRLLDIGGSIGIDLVSMRTKADRAAVDAALSAACSGLGLVERTSVNGFGFAQIIRPRSRLSVPEILCGITPGRLTTERRAIALLRQAEQSTGFGMRQIIAPPAIINLIRQWPEDVSALRHQLGVAIELVSGTDISSYGYVHVAQT